MHDQYQTFLLGAKSFERGYFMASDDQGVIRPVMNKGAKLSDVSQKICF